MKTSIAVALFALAISTSAGASINENYLSKQIIRQKLDQNYFYAVVSDSVNKLVVDISIHPSTVQPIELFPIKNADEPNLDSPDF